MRLLCWIFGYRMPGKENQGRHLWEPIGRHYYCPTCGVRLRESWGPW